MRHPWQTWLVFAICLALALGAMTWLTVQGIELDRAEAAARQQLEVSRRNAIALQRQAERLQDQSELEELVSQALWRMDTALAPVLAQEAARPYFVYRPYFTLPAEKTGKSTAAPAASPLLKQPSPFVRLHFQVDARGVCTSPQVPSGAFEQLALEQGVTRDDLARSKQWLGELQEKLHRPELLACLPDQMLPVLSLNDANWEQFNSAWALQFGPNTRRNNFEALPDEPGLPGQQAVPQVVPTQQLAADSAPPQTTARPNPDEQGGQSPAIAEEGEASLAPAGTPAQSAVIAPGTRGPQSPSQPPRTSAASPAQQSEYEPNYQVVGSPYAPNGVGLSVPPPVTSLADQGNEGRVQFSRVNTKWQDRNRALQAYAAQTLMQMRGANATEPQTEFLPAIPVSEGVTRPFWIGSELFFARRVMIGGDLLIQGCWLDWPALRERLLEDVSDLLPQVELVPVSEATPDGSRLLATLPIELKLSPVSSADLGTAPAEVAVATAAVSPLGFALWLAWACLILAAGAVAALLLGVVSLSERRAAFVAAVTHELRTPLTTFRMYAEMLEGNMVADEARRKQYLETLRIEADRLYHLVENVLSYARLERGPSPDRLQRIAVDELWERMRSRLSDRAIAARMELVLEADEEIRLLELRTDPTAVEQILFNLVDNACKYAALAENRTIHLNLVRDGDLLRCTVRDHGPGISAAAANRLFQPFSKSVHEAADSAPGVGLGLALSQRLAGELGGDLLLAPGDANQPGACFVLSLPLAK